MGYGSNHKRLGQRSARLGGAYALLPSPHSVSTFILLGFRYSPVGDAYGSLKCSTHSGIPWSSGATVRMVTPRVSTRDAIRLMTRRWFWRSRKTVETEKRKISPTKCETKTSRHTANACIQVPRHCRRVAHLRGCRGRSLPILVRSIQYFVVSIDGVQLPASW